MLLLTYSLPYVYIYICIYIYIYIYIYARSPPHLTTSPLPSPLSFTHDSIIAIRCITCTSWRPTETSLTNTKCASSHHQLHSYALTHHSPRSLNLLNFVQNKAADAWNSLPDKLINSESVTSFKRSLWSVKY